MWSQPIFKGIISGVFRDFTQDERPSTLKDESVGDFISRRMHPNIANNLLSAVFHGIYAGDIWQLSAKSLLSFQWNLEGKFGSITRGLIQLERQKHRFLPKANLDLWKESNSLSAPFRKALGQASVFTLRHGLQQITDRLLERLSANPNITFRNSAAISTLSKLPDSDNKIKISFSSPQGHSQTASHTAAISTLSSSTTAALCTSSSPSSSSSSSASSSNTTSTLLPTLSSTPSVTVAVINLYFSTPPSDLLPALGFGYLIPQSIPFAQNPERALGIVFDSCATVGQDSAPGTKLTVMMGGHWWDGWTSYPSSEEAVAMARSVLARHLGVVEEPERTAVVLQERCIPQYTVGHSERLAKAHAVLDREFGGRVRVAGNSYTGVGVNDCVRAGREVARGVAGSLGSGDWRGKTGLEGFTKETEFVEVAVVASRRGGEMEKQKEEMEK